MENNGIKEKTQVYNVVILDKSGSMSSIRRAAVDGFNETLAGIKKAQEQLSETQQHYFSLVAFTLSIRNARNFDYSAEGAKSAMCRDSSTRMGLFSRIHDYRMSHIEEDAAAAMGMTMDNYYNKHKLAKQQYEQIWRKEVQHA